MHSLPVFVRLTGRTVIVVGQGDTADAKRRLVERAGAIVVSDEHAAAPFAFVAIDDVAEAGTVAERLRARGILVNVADQPALCDFTLPAIVDRDPVIVAIGTGGASAGLAAALRQRLETLLPARLGTLASALAQARAAMRRRWPDGAARRRALAAFFSPGAAGDVLSGGEGEAAVARWLGADDTVPEQQIAVIRLSSDDPDDLTLAQARLLAMADRLWHHPDVPDAILDRARADAPRTRSATPPADAADGLTLWLERAR